MSELEDDLGDESDTVSVVTDSHWANRKFGVATKSDSAKRKLIIVVIICFTWMVVEIIAAAITGSLALLTDAVDLLKDLAEFGVNIACINYSKKKSDLKHTFGYLKAETLGAFVSVLLIWIFYTLLFFESIHKLIKGGEKIEAGLMLYVSIVALILNIIKAFILGADDDEAPDDGKLDLEKEDRMEEIPASSFSDLDDLANLESGKKFEQKA